MPVTEKSPDAFRTIGEVARWLETPAHVLRFWESRFPEIAPVKGAGGRRYYRPEDMRLLGGIKQLLHEDGHTIKAVQEQLAAEGAAAVAAHSPDLPTAASAPREQRELADAEPKPATPANDTGRPPIGYFFDDSAPDPAPTGPTAGPDTVQPPRKAELGRIDSVQADPDDPGAALSQNGPTVAAHLRGLEPRTLHDAARRVQLTSLAGRLQVLLDRSD